MGLPVTSKTGDEILANEGKGTQHDHGHKHHDPKTFDKKPDTSSNPAKPEEVATQEYLERMEEEYAKREGGA